MAPKDITDGDITYDSIKASVITHLQPKRILHYERHLLHSMVQKDGELASNFVERLKEQASRCELGSMRDDLLLSQFIFGLRSQPVRAKLLSDPSLDLAKALKEALLHESVATATGTDAVVAAIHTTPRGRKPSR